MESLELQKWSRFNLDYFTEGRMTHFGLASYWCSINSAFETWDRSQMKAAISAKFVYKLEHKYPNITNEYKRISQDIQYSGGGSS